jgi:predicted dehydrogenase
MTEGKIIRVGIIGCGKIAQVRHIPEYAAPGRSCRSQ